MENIKIIALGNELAGDDRAAIEAVSQLSDEYNVIVAGRPGLDLIDYLDSEDPIVLVDVTSSDSEPGRIHEMTMDKLQEAALADVSYSSHGFGPSETLKLMKSLDKKLPEGRFVGVEGKQFRVGTEISSSVSNVLPDFVSRIKSAVLALSGSEPKEDRQSA
jgi:hydrogenase maturation protease